MTPTELAAVAAVASAVVAVGTWVMAILARTRARNQRKWDILIKFQGGYSRQGLRITLNEMYGGFKNSKTVCDAVTKVYRLIPKREEDGFTDEFLNAASRLTKAMQIDLGIDKIILGTIAREKKQKGAE